MKPSPTASPSPRAEPTRFAGAVAVDPAVAELPVPDRGSGHETGCQQTSSMKDVELHTCPYSGVHSGRICRGRLQARKGRLFRASHEGDRAGRDRTALLFLGHPRRRGIVAKDGP